MMVDGGVGCVHPWPELGDAELGVHLEALRAGGGTALVERALECARVDGAARREGVSLFEGVEMAESHFTCVSEEVVVPDGFAVVKVKAGRELGGLEARLAGVGQRVRIDFNGILEKREFDAWGEGIGEGLRRRIDFVEDPYGFDREGWKDSEAKTGLKLGLDRGSGEWGLRVVKPAVEDVPLGAERVVVTSAMDHPVGQLWAALVASRLPGEVHGVMTQHLFERDQFVEALGVEGARLARPGGTGLGFDELLREVPWTRP